jgi:hypothetical protein
MGARQGILWSIVSALCVAVPAGDAGAQAGHGHGGGHGGAGHGGGPGWGGGPGHRGGPDWGGGPSHRGGPAWGGGHGHGFDQGHRGGPGWHGDGFAHHDFGGWHQGHWHHGPHNGRLGWWWIVGPSWYYYPAPVYPYPEPYYYPPALIGTVPPLPGQPTQYWYYCSDPPGYYPYIPQCNVMWQAVAAWPPG